MTQSGLFSVKVKKKQSFSRTIIQIKEDNDNLKSIIKETNAENKTLAKGDYPT